MPHIHLDPHALPLQTIIKGVSYQVAAVAVVKVRRAKVLVLINQPADVPPQEVHQRAMWIAPLVGELMVYAMDGHPAGWRLLQAAHPKNRQGMFEPFGHD